MHLNTTLHDLSRSNLGNGACSHAVLLWKDTLLSCSGLEPQRNPEWELKSRSSQTGPLQRQGAIHKIGKPRPSWSIPAHLSLGPAQQLSGLYPPSQNLC